MVDSLEVRIACPSISFLFAHLGGSLGNYPFLENFVYEGNSLSVVLGEIVALAPSIAQLVRGFRRERINVWG